MIAVEVRQWRRLADGSNRGSSCISSDSFSDTSSDIMNKRGGGRAGGGRPGAEHPLCPESGATRESRLRYQCSGCCNGNLIGLSAVNATAAHAAATPQMIKAVNAGALSSESFFADRYGLELKSSVGVTKRGAP